MLNNIRKDLTINFLTNGETGTCNGCVARRGTVMGDVEQIIYLTVSWNERDYTQMGIDKMIKVAKEAYCYYCSMDLTDK